MHELMSETDGRPLVLIVEDESRMRDLLSDVLPRMGYRAESVSTAEGARRAVAERRPDVLLLDVQLPTDDGLTLLGELRGRLGDVPAIVMTAFGSLEVARRAIREGVVEFLCKPFPLGELDRALGKARLKLAKDRVPRVSGMMDEFGEEGAAERGGRTVSEVKREELVAALERCGWNKSAAARELGISRRTLYNWVKRYGLADESGW